MIRLRHALLTLAFVACSSNLEPEPVDPPASSDGIVVEDLGNDTWALTIDATSEAEWVHVDLATHSRVATTSPATSNDWDLGFLRSNIKVNGGVSGAGSAAAIALAFTDFDALGQAPKEGYLVDRTADGSAQMPPEFVVGPGAKLAFAEPHAASDNGWYDYDFASHTLSPSNVTYVVRDRSGGYWKLRFLDYYDDAGTPAFVKIKIAKVTAPTTEPIAISAGNDWVYLTVAGQIVAVAEPATSLAWDFAVKRTAFKTNGGTSGSGDAGAGLADRDFAAVDELTTVGFVRDRDLPLPGPPGSGSFSGNPTLNDWYDYDPVNHVASPKNVTFVLRGAKNSYGKLKIVTYSEGNFTVEVAPLTARIEPKTLTVSSTIAGEWVHVSFEAGNTVTIADPATSPDWDLAISRTLIATNSGVSGAGAAGAVATDAAHLAALEAAPIDGYQADVMIPLPGPPGSGEVAANPVLADWYNYDPATHAVTPKSTIWAVKTARGDYVKLAITGWANGALTFEYVYAGPDRGTF